MARKNDRVKKSLCTFFSNRCMGTCNKSTCSERVCTDPPILGHLQLPVAAGHLQQPPAAATSSNINHLQLFTTCSGHLQLFYNFRRLLAAISTTCSNALDLYGTEDYGTVPWYLNSIYFNFWVKQEWTVCIRRIFYAEWNIFRQI